MSSNKYNEQKSDELLQNFNNDLGLLSSSDYATTSEDIIDKIENDIKGSDVQIKNQIEDIFFNNVHDYVTETFNGIIYNDLINVNKYIGKNLFYEMQRLNKNFNFIKNNIQRLRYQYNEIAYTIKKNVFITNLVKLSILASLLIFLFYQLGQDNLYPKIVSIVLMVITLFIYLLVLVYNILNNKDRKYGNWDEFDFKVKPSKKMK